MIVICYDGSKDARAAVERAAELFPSQEATVLTVWEPVMEVWARTTPGFGLVPSISNTDEIDAETRKAADETAAGGVKLAEQLGLKAQPEVAIQESTTGRAIVKAAEALDATVIVMGTRGLTGVKSLFLGSVSHEVATRADRTVMIVPSAELAASRADDLAGGEG